MTAAAVPDPTGLDGTAGIRAGYLPVDGRLAYVERLGTGPAVLLIHTAGQSGVQWRHTIGPLAAAGYEAVVVDLPGHGRSEPAVDGPVTDLSWYARWLCDLLPRLGVVRPFVVGCSIGGKIALDLGVRLGDGVAGVVAMAADAKNGSASESGLRRELQDSAAPSRTDRTYFGTLSVIGAGLPPSVREMIATMHRREDPTVSTSDLIGWATHDLRARLPEITVPTRLVAGRADLWLDLDRVTWAADQIPNATLTVLDDIGHYPMEEMPDFGTVLVGWLAEMHHPTAADATPEPAATTG